MTNYLNTLYGAVEGTFEKGVYRFLGIPYAKAPIGELRFRDPQPLVQWSEPIRADKYPKNPIQKHKDMDFSNNCKIKDDSAKVMLSSKLFARKVYIRADGVNQPWSDNFFDIPAGECKTLSVSLPEGMTKESFERSIQIRTLADVEPKNHIVKDKLLRMRIFLKKSNLVAWIMFKFL